jgi:thioesterase domain-containing protein
VHPLGGDALRFAELSRRLGDDQPFYALEAVGLHDRQPPHATIEAMAEYYLEAVRAAQPRGPYYLGGYCLGGVVAFEMARQLAARGEHAALVAIFEGHAPARSRVGQPRWTRERLGYFLDNLPGWAAEVRALGPDYLWRRSQQVAARLGTLAVGKRGAASLAPTAARHQAVQAAHLAALRAYLPSGPYPGRVTVMNVRHQSLRLDPDPRRGWQRLALGGVTVQRLPGSHHTLLQPPQVQALAEALRHSLDAARAAWLAADTHELQTA